MKISSLRTKRQPLLSVRLKCCQIVTLTFIILNELVQLSIRFVESAL